MEVILLERVEKLGAIGDVVTVKNGFARNYLLPRKKALRANEANRKLFEANRAKIESDNAERRTAAQGSAQGVDGKTVQLIRQASNTGQLYGSVSARDIVEARGGGGAKATRTEGRAGRPSPGACPRPALRFGRRPRHCRGAGGRRRQGDQEPGRARPPHQGHRHARD